MPLTANPLTAKGNSSDDLRRNNLSLLLRLVHHSQGVSRSQLTQLTGLNRSTIAVLVGELVERGLVIETEPDASNKVGRPSPVVKPGTSAVGIAVHPEIDAITVGQVGLGRTVTNRVRHALDHIPSLDEVVDISARLIEDLRVGLSPGQRIIGVGVAVPGLVRAEDGVVRLAPHLGWHDAPLAEQLAAATALPVSVANDATLGCLAESIFGVGRGVSDLVYINGGASGVGGGVLASGRPLGGVAGYAGELGHTFVSSNGIRCHCGAIGCLETEVGRSALLRLLALADADADTFAAELLASVSAAVSEEVHRQLGFLAIAVRNAINLLNPRLVVLGGFLGALHAVDPQFLRDRVNEQALSVSQGDVSIVRSELGRDLLMVGAAELAFADILIDPTKF